MPYTRCLRSSSSIDSYEMVQNGENKADEKIPWPLWQKVTLISGIALLSLLVLLFFSIWVVFPLVFMNSISLQRFFMFFPVQNPKQPEFDNPLKYDIKGVMNFYITVKDIEKSENISTLVSIGAWVILPESDINETIIQAHNISSAKELLQKTTYPVLLYMHGVACNRILPTSTYEVARKYFFIISLDHRGYGDSGADVVQSELGIVNDTAQIYKWILDNTKNEVYIWGHSLGTALSTHTVKKLKEEYNQVPMGLILESPFTTMREEVENNSLGTIFKWLAYFESTVQRPLEKNGFLFRTTTNILSVDCPIMIMHAMDDNVIPIALGRKLSEVARNERTIPQQGNVTYHEFIRLGYAHTGITRDPNIPKYLVSFMEQCRDQNKMRR
nr:monoacylglycerol lipase ABHD12-like isoform X1 [Leptinotarsa decemlineata]